MQQVLLFEKQISKPPSVVTHISHESVPKSRFMTASPLGEKLSSPGSSEPGDD